MPLLSKRFPQIAALALASAAVLAGCAREPGTVQTDTTQQHSSRAAPVGTSATALPTTPDSAVDTDVPYVPTSPETVNRMLEMAGVTAQDTVYDLGSGDGRIVIAAAQQYGAYGVGVEIDPKRIEGARKNAQVAGVTDRVEFRQGDLFEADLSGATVVTLYLLPSVNKELRPKLVRELEAGTPVVSHDFDMGSWEPERTVQVGDDTVYRWTIPEGGLDESSEGR